MLIYAAADIHGHPRRIRRLRRQIAVHRPDILLLAGDISRRWQPEVILHGLNRLGLPVLLIRGISDSRNIDRLLPSFPRLRSIHLSAAHRIYRVWDQGRADRTVRTSSPNAFTCQLRIPSTVRNP